MHPNMESVEEMKVEHHNRSTGHDYGTNRWDAMGDDHSPRHSPNHDLHEFGFVSPSNVSLDQPYSSSFSPMPSYASTQPQQQVMWPSMLTNPSENETPPPLPAPVTLPRPLAPITKINTAPPKPAPAPPPTVSTSRRTLTDQDRRKMCQFHEDNPSVKQSQIGGK